MGANVDSNASTRRKSGELSIGGWVCEIMEADCSHWPAIGLLLVPFLFVKYEICNVTL